MSETVVQGEIVREKRKYNYINKPGRPPKVTPEQRVEVYEAFKKFIAYTPDPMLAAFCAWDPVAIKYDIIPANLNDWPEFSLLRNRALIKQEAYLATGAATGKLNPTMCIFRLKQPVHGYKDRVDTDITSGGNALPAPIIGLPASTKE